MNTIGRQLKTIRTANNLTQEELATLCNVNGWSITRVTIAKIETKLRGVSDIEVALLAQVLKVEISELFPKS